MSYCACIICFVSASQSEKIEQRLSKNAYFLISKYQKHKDIENALNLAQN